MQEPYQPDEIECEDEGIRFFKGLMWGIVLSIPLWISIFGWVKFIRSLFA